MYVRPCLAGLMAFAPMAAWTSPARAELESVDLRVPSGQHRFERRLVEVAVRSGGALAVCQDGCDPLRPFGLALGLGLTLRASTTVAVGFLYESAWFRTQREGGSRTTADVFYGGLVARFYPVSNGQLDPWMEFGMILAAYGSASAPSSTGLGTGAGLDVFVSDRLKLGPHARFDFRFPTRETSSSTSGSSSGPSGPVTALVQVGGAVTFTFGEVR